MQLIDFQTLVCPVGAHRDAPKSGAKYVGQLELAQLPRFASEVQSGSPLEASLEYGQDIDGAYIDVSLKASCQILCQFCLSTYTHNFSSNNRFRPVLTLEAAREISDDCEPVLYENGFVNIINMLEDDALLALPNYPKCRECDIMPE